MADPPTGIRLKQGSGRRGAWRRWPTYPGDPTPAAAETRIPGGLIDQQLPPVWHAHDDASDLPDGDSPEPQANYLINEAHNQVRRIYLDEPQVAPEEADPWYSGHSVGQWKEGTLYVDTVGFKIGLRDVPHSDQMRVREEIRLLKTGLLEDKVTVIDPVYLADTWQWAWQYERKPGYKIDEYVCENNHEYIDAKTGTQRESFVGAH